MRGCLVTLELHFSFPTLFTTTMILTTIYFLLILCAFRFTCGTPAPLNQPNQLRPITPIIRPGFSAGEVTQIKDAFDDAMTIAMAAVESPIEIVAPIFEKYFYVVFHDRVNGENPFFWGGGEPPSCARHLWMQPDQTFLTTTKQKFSKI